MSRISAIVASAEDIEHEDVTVGAWRDVKIQLRSMSLANRGAYLEEMIAARDADDSIALGKVQAKLLIEGAYDPDTGEKVFAQSDIPMLLGKHGGVVAALANKVTRLSGLDADAEERLGKGSSASGETPSDDSSSSSPES